MGQRNTHRERKATGHTYRCCQTCSVGNSNNSRGVLSQQTDTGSLNTCINTCTNWHITFNKRFNISIDNIYCTCTCTTDTPAGSTSSNSSRTGNHQGCNGLSRCRPLDQIPISVNAGIFHIGTNLGRCVFQIDLLPEIGIVIILYSQIDRSFTIFGIQLRTSILIDIPFLNPVFDPYSISFNNF